MIEITKEYRFHYAHRNHLLDDKCNRIHGHTAYVFVTLQFEGLNDSGVALLFGDIDKVCEPIVQMFDHWLLVWDGDTKLLEGLAKAELDHFVVDWPTSAENLARYFFHAIRDAGLPVYKVVFKETPSSAVAYSPPTYPE